MQVIIYAVARGLLRRPIVVVNAVLLAAVIGATGWRLSASPTVASGPPPADLFMQSVATEDGDLGWDQLCPSLQGQLPRQALEQQATTQRTSRTQQGVTLTVDFVGDRPRPAGGEVRIYVATAHGTDGAAGQKTYVVQTQPSGCVESVN
jgi:hypothetical protein